MSGRKKIYSLQDSDEIRRLLEMSDSVSDDDVPSSDEDMSDILDEIDIENYLDPDFLPEEDSKDEGVEEFDEEEAEVNIQNTIIDIETATQPEPTTSAQSNSAKKKAGKQGSSAKDVRGGNTRRGKKCLEEGEKTVLNLDGDEITGREKKDGLAFVSKTKPIPRSGRTPGRNVIHITIQESLNMTTQPPTQPAAAENPTEEEAIPLLALPSAVTQSAPQPTTFSGHDQENKKPAKRVLCSICPPSLKRKTSTVCSKCERLICGSHVAKTFCPDC